MKALTSVSLCALFLCAITSFAAQKNDRRLMTPSGCMACHRGTVESTPSPKKQSNKEKKPAQRRG